MHRIARFRILLLALMVVVSHVALLSHATAHFHPALEQCELCVSQAHPQAALPATEAVLPEVQTWLPRVAPIGQVQPPSPPSHQPSQRAPPLASS